MLDANQIKERLSTEDIVKLCCFLQGDDTVFYDAQEHPIFNTCICHGGDSNKLYYYPETQLFHCYTCSSSYDIFELLHRHLNLELPQAIKYIEDFFGIEERGFDEDKEEELTSDWDIFQKIKDYEQIGTATEGNKSIPENLLEYFYPLAAPIEWQKEGISSKVMLKYGIRVDSALHKVIIPHRDINGKLIGIRGRSFDPLEVEAGKKYMPVFIQGDVYRHSLGQNLFGLYENKETIKRLKKACIFEAEKSVMQIATMYGIDNCFAVASCGSNISKEQMNLLLDLGVTEIIIAFDADQTGVRGDKDVVEYEEKLRKLADPMLPYVNVSVIFDYDHLLPHKASPSDIGKETFETLYHNRVKLNTYNEKLERRRK